MRNLSSILLNLQCHGSWFGRMKQIWVHATNYFQLRLFRVQPGMDGVTIDWSSISVQMGTTVSTELANPVTLLIFILLLAWCSSSWGEPQSESVVIITDKAMTFWVWWTNFCGNKLNDFAKSSNNSTRLHCITAVAVVLKLPFVPTTVSALSQLPYHFYNIFQNTLVGLYCNLVHIIKLEKS